MSGFVHPATIAYALSFAAPFGFPLLTSEALGTPCRELASDWAVVIGAGFVSAFAHSFYCLWLLERAVSSGIARADAAGVEREVLEAGEGIARTGTVWGWIAYFAVRIALSAVAAVASTAAEVACVPVYHQTLAFLLVVDSAFVLLVFAASWSAERIAKENAAIAARMSDAAKQTHRGKGKEKKKE